MTHANLLLIAREALASELAQRVGPERVCCKSDPYEALMEMGRRRWPAILIQAAVGDYAGLCRASRRLQADSRLLGLCGVADEMQVRQLVGPVLDDYLICPPSPDDVKALRQLASGEAMPVVPSSAALRADLMAGLIESARSMPELESHLLGLAARLTGAKARWALAAEIGSGDLPLLLLGRDNRLLVCPRSAGPLSEDAAGALQAIQRCLPVLTANAARMDSLHRLAVTDHLTGAYNRRYFYTLTEQVLAQARATRARVALLLYDIDDFKRYNDHYSYAVGDAILCQVAALMKRVSRTHDIIARIGGDEFAILFWDRREPRKAASRPLQTAYDLADRFRAAVAKEEFTLLGPHATGRLTISGGLAIFPRDGQSVRELLRAADRALKFAKKAGKNGIALVGA